MRSPPHSLVGLKPVLRLKTADGFAYEENDSLNVALEQNMILATVLDWQISPLGQRYEEMCHQLKRGTHIIKRNIFFLYYINVYNQQFKQFT